MSFRNNFAAASFLFLAASSAAICLPKPAQAACVSPGVGSNCGTFTSDTTSLVTQDYTSINLDPNNYFQVGFRSSDGLAYSVSDVQYSDDNSTWHTIGASTTGASYNYGPIITFDFSVPFHIRYTLPTGVPNGVYIDSNFVGNNNGSSSGGLLTDLSGNNYLSVSRSSLSLGAPAPEPVPGPLPILGAAAAFSQARRLRKRIYS